MQKLLRSIFHLIMRFSLLTLDFFFLIATGHVMHIDGKEGGGVFSDANLEYSVDQGAALGCQIRY